MTYFELVVGALRFSEKAFVALLDLSNSLEVAVAIVVVAGLATALGQSVVLFINRVRPLRFVLSLLASALVYSLSYLLLGLTIWGSSHLFGTSASLAQILSLTGLAHAPYLLAALVFAPYLGVALGTLLSVWHVLLLLFGVQIGAELSLWQALLCACLPWLLLQSVQRSVWTPLADWRRRLAAHLAGVAKFREVLQAQDLIEERLEPALKAATESISK